MTILLVERNIDVAALSPSRRPLLQYGEIEFAAGPLDNPVVLSSYLGR